MHRAAAEHEQMPHAVKVADALVEQIEYDFARMEQGAGMQPRELEFALSWAQDSAGSNA